MCVYEAIVSDSKLKLVKSGVSAPIIFHLNPSNVPKIIFNDFLEASLNFPQWKCYFEKKKKKIALFCEMKRMWVFFMNQQRKYIIRHKSFFFLFFFLILNYKK